MRYRLHGLEIESNLPLDATAGRGGRADLAVVLRNGPPWPRPVGDPIARFPTENGYQVWRVGEHFLLSYPELAGFRVTASEICVALEGASTDLASLFVTGTAMALVLLARRELVLHASAVAVDGRAVAIAGSTGMGKSTWAALACAAGLHLIADDVLRVTLGPSGPVCHVGSTSLRLRPGASTIGNLLRHWSQRESVDGRLVLSSPDAPVEMPLPLAGIVLPGFSSGNGVRRAVTGADALTELLKHPRVLGWRDPEVLALLTRQLASLARAVPVFQCSARRAPPFDAELAEQVRSLVCFT